MEAKLFLSIRRLGTLLCVCIFVTVALYPVQASAAELQGTELEEHLIAKSPWAGEWDTPGTRFYGKVVYVFERLDGKFSAKITEATGTTTDATGPVLDLKVEGDTVSFVSAAGTRHEFKLTDKGGMFGKGVTRFGRDTYTRLKPAK